MTLYTMLQEQYPEYSYLSDTERYAIAQRLFDMLQEEVTDEQRHDIEQRLLLLHGRLALHIVQQAKHRFFFNARIDDVDLEQVAFEGLLLAIRGFDPSLGYQFSTYAVKAIQARINRLERELGTDLHISQGALDLFIQARKYVSDIEEISLSTLRQIDKDNEWSDETLQQLLRAFKTNVVSLYKSVQEEKTLEIIIPDKNTNTENEAIENVQMAHLAQKIKQELDEREFTIFSRYYGLFGQGQQTLRELATTYRVSHQAIHQILRNRILPKIRKLLRHEITNPEE